MPDDATHLLPVDSSAIAGIRYEDSTTRLYIRFRTSSTVYTFCNVPEWVFLGLLHAPSKGTFYSENIKDRYPC